MAKNPRTIVGMPAIVSRTGLTMLRTRVEAYSASRIADSRPSGTPMTIAIAATSSVPLIERQHAELVGLDGGRPDRAGQEVDRVDLLEELRASGTRG